MIILGIETSCDETSAAILEANEKNFRITLKSNIVSSSLKLHQKTGGIVPEIAAREQIKYILPVIKKAISEANFKTSQIDAIAVTYGPGLLGSLLVGVETAKTLSFIWEKPLIPINHLYGHIYANFIGQQIDYGKQTTAKNNKAVVGSRSAISYDIKFPAIGLVVSGGHTDLVLMKSHNDIRWLGGTRDDAAGECLDKVGRLLGLSYPAGPQIEKLAKEGDANRFNFPSPLINSSDFDFSFSGLKTAVLREVKTIKQPARPAGGLNNQTIQDICASVQKAIVDVLLKKTLIAAKKYNAKSILIGGGVAANSSLRENFIRQLGGSNFKLDAQFFAPPKNLCTDNAAMIAVAAFFNYRPKSYLKIDADPSLHC